MTTTTYSIHETTDDYGFQYVEDPIAVVTIQKTDNEADDMHSAKKLALTQIGRSANDAGFYRAIPVTQEDILGKIEELEDKKYVWLRGLGSIVDVASRIQRR